MREILDHAGTVDEAVDILAGYNIEMGNVPLHYLIASAAGESALVEFYQGKMVVFRNVDPWQLATNFLVASTGGHTKASARATTASASGSRRRKASLPPGALDLLADVSQDRPQAQSNTQWSVVYDLTGGYVHIVMGRKYTGEAHTLRLSLSGR